MLSKTLAAERWLNNFEPGDRDAAATLLDRLMIVGAGEFKAALVETLNQVSAFQRSQRYTVALYAEREMGLGGLDVAPFFPGTGSGRASGAGIPPVQVKASKQDVGSEGIIAAFITKYCALPSSCALSHPGPDALRSERVRRIVIVTDFLGTGNRVGGMLDAFSLVASIRSWQSYKLLDFCVVCYSGTEAGIKRVKSHPLSPQVFCHIACPTIEDEFFGAELRTIQMLCEKYPRSKNRRPFGYRNTGSLIVFSHGIPNNAPALLHSRLGRWKPLFPSRSVVIPGIDELADRRETLVARSQHVLGIREARRVLSDQEGASWVKVALVLRTLRNRRGTLARISAFTRLPVEQVQEIVGLSQKAGWVTKKLNLTGLGRRELWTMEAYQNRREPIEFLYKDLYFPTQLRAP